MDNTKIIAIEDIYNQINSCQKCIECHSAIIREDPYKVPRKILPESIDSKIMIVSQSLAEDQARLSGIQFHDKQGSIGKSGKFLEKYLNQIGYSLKPDKACFQYVYATDIVKCYPGKKTSGTGDNKPTSKETNNCWSFFDSEIKVINPKIIISLGQSSAEIFYNKITGKKRAPLSNMSREMVFDLGAKQIPLFMLPHPVSMVRGKACIYETIFNNIKTLLLSDNK